MVGETLNHYRILGKLGEGGMAEVYLAEDTRLGRKVALKVLPQSVADDPGRIERFEREAKAVAALNHPNIVTIYSVEEAGGIRFLTMELVDGKPLDDLIPDGGMDLDEFFRIALPLTEAVGAAHRKGVTHRDIKPGNVMINSEGVVKLLDLGLAKLDPALRDSEDATAAETLTQEGRAIGTVPYMAPEQLAGKRVDHRVDIYALGVVLYEMLTGQRPFLGSSSAELISAILRDRPKQVTELKATLPNGLDHTVRRAIEKRPEERFQSAEDFGRALATVAAAQPSESAAAGHETVRLKRPKSRRGGRALALAGGGVLALLLAAALLLWLPAGEPTDEATPAPVPTLALRPVVETGVEPATGIAGDFEIFLRGTLEEVEGLRLTTPDDREESTAAAADYVIETSLSWDEEASAEDRARFDFEMTRVEDGSVIWAEHFERLDATETRAQRELAATVRSRVGRLLGLDVPDAPAWTGVTEDETTEAAAEPPRTPPARRQAERAPAAPSPAGGADSTTVTPEPGAEARSTDPSEPTETTASTEAAEPLEAGEAPLSENVSLSLSLVSEVSTGVVTFYADGVQIYRQVFDFSEKKGGVLGRVGLRRRGGGTLEEALQIPADSSELRLYVAVADEPAVSFPLDSPLRGDGTDRLVVEIRDKQDISARLE